MPATDPPEVSKSKPRSKPWFTRDASYSASYQAGGTLADPSAPRAYTNDPESPAFDPAPGPDSDRANAWESRFGWRVDAMAAAAYLAGPLTGEYPPPRTPPTLTHASPRLPHPRDPQRLCPLPRQVSPPVLLPVPADPPQPTSPPCSPPRSSSSSSSSTSSSPSPPSSAPSSSSPLSEPPCTLPLGPGGMHRTGWRGTGCRISARSLRDG